MRSFSIRWKLTLWYAAVLAVTLLIFGGTIYWLMCHQMMERIDDGLSEELSDVRTEITQSKNDKSLLEWLDHRFAHHEGFDYQISRTNGTRFFANTRLEHKTLPLPSQIHPTSERRLDTVDLPKEGQWRIVSETVTGPDGPLIIQVARSLAQYDYEAQEVFWTLVLTGLAMCIITMGAGYFLAGRALSPVQAITQTAEQITAYNLTQRVKVPNKHDELGALAATLNRMIGRLDQSFQETQRFTADAAHELRTPLAVMRNEAEVTLRQPRTSAEYCSVLENMLEEIIRLSELADKLLFLCRHDAGLYSAPCNTIELDKLLDDVVSQMKLVANEKQVALALAENPKCQILGDELQVRRVFYNLFDNAIKYTPANGSVTIASHVADGFVSIRVTDTGIGIPEEHLPHVLERFYRVDSSRTDNGGGAGLGLSITQSIVKSMKGTIQLSSSPEGTTATVRLPVGRKDGV